MIKNKLVRKWLFILVGILILSNLIISFISPTQKEIYFSFSSERVPKHASEINVSFKKDDHSDLFQIENIDNISFRSQDYFSIQIPKTSYEIYDLSLTNDNFYYISEEFTIFKTSILSGSYSDDSTNSFDSIDSLRDFLEANGNLLAKGEDELIIYPTADTNWFSIDFLANTLLITESENLDNCDVEFRINNYIYLSLDISQGCKDRENRLIEIEKSVYTLEPTILLGENLVYSSQENNQTFQSKDLLLFVDGAHSGIYITFSNGDLSARIPKLNPEQYQSLIIRSGRADIQISDISGTLTMGKNQYTVTEYSLLEAGISSIDEFYYSFPSTNDQSILGAEARLLLRGIAKKITLNKESVIPAVGNNRQELTIQTLNSIISIIITVLVAGAIESTPKESSDLSKLENKDDKERIEK